MIRYALLSALCSIFLYSSAAAEENRLDPTGAYHSFWRELGVPDQTVILDEKLIERIHTGHQSTDANAVARLIEALETTYFNAEVGEYVSPSKAFGTTHISHNGSLVLVRFYLNTIRASKTEQEDFFILVEQVLGEPLKQSADKSISEIWDSYLDPTKRQNDHGWINLSEVENRAMAWGAPPDFVEVVVTTRTDCEFLPVKGWLPRQICP